MEKKKKLYYLIGIGVVVLAIIVCIIVWAATRNKNSAPAEIPPVASMKPDREVVYRDVEKLVEVEKVISSQIIQDGLRDMGFLVTEEYYFTEVVSYSSVKKLFKSIDLKVTETNYLASYDGVVSAGVDFFKIGVVKNEENKTLRVTIPKATIYSTTIDENSLQVYSEKYGLGNPVTVTDFNNSLSELKANAEDKAIDRGTLERAEENAQRIITNFVESLVDPNEYFITYVVR